MALGLFDSALDVADHFEAIGHPLDLSFKRRDRREPGRRQKEAAELRLMAIMRRYWRGQRKRIRERLQNRYAWRKAVGDIDYLASDFAEDFWNQEAQELTPDLLRLLLGGAVGGTEILAGSSRIGLDTASAIARASEWARHYVGELVKQINQTTLASLRQAVATFVETQGFTIADVMDMLPYGDSRAERIAITEVTNAYAEGQLLAGEELAEQFPGVAVVKLWMTEMDDRVCEICGPMDGQEVDIEAEFKGGDGELYQQPPAHPRCRCFLETRTDISA
jgi:hypothetical protein